MRKLSRKSPRLRNLIRKIFRYQSSAIRLGFAIVEMKTPAFFISDQVRKTNILFPILIGSLNVV